MVSHFQETMNVLFAVYTRDGALTTMMCLFNIATNTDNEMYFFIHLNPTKSVNKQIVKLLETELVESMAYPKSSLPIKNKMSRLQIMTARTMTDPLMASTWACIEPKHPWWGVELSSTKCGTKTEVCT